MNGRWGQAELEITGPVHRLERENDDAGGRRIVCCQQIMEGTIPSHLLKIGSILISSDAHSHTKFIILLWEKVENQWNSAFTRLPIPLKGNG